MGVGLAFWNDVLRDALSCLDWQNITMFEDLSDRQAAWNGRAKMSLIALKGHMNYFSDLSRADLL
jgi:hypothetical protein